MASLDKQIHLRDAIIQSEFVESLHMPDTAVNTKKMQVNQTAEFTLPQRTVLKLKAQNVRSV